MFYVHFWISISEQQVGFIFLSGLTQELSILLDKVPRANPIWRLFRRLQTKKVSILEHFHGPILLRHIMSTNLVSPGKVWWYT